MFLLSLLSKAMAASLPVVLILTDYFKGRKINARSLLEKVPFFFLAITLGVVAVLAQKSSDAIQDIGFYTFFQRIIFASYGFISYLVKIVSPLKLSAYYPYPVSSGGVMPAIFYTYLFIAVLFFVFIFYSLRFSKKVFMGIGFFTVTVFLVLQLLPVGGAIMADRYGYIPSIGIFYLAGEGFVFLWQKKLKAIPAIVLLAFTVFFSVKTFSQSKLWENDLILWNDVIRQDKSVSKAYYNRGTFLLKNNKIQEALDDFNKTLALAPNYTEAYVNRGNVLRDNKRIEDALKDYNKAIEIKPDFAIAYFNRGTLFMNEKRNVEAFKDLNKAIELKPSYYQAYHNRGNIFTNEKKFEDAIKDYSKAVELKADYSISYYGRGVAQYYTGKKDAACSDMKKAAELGYKIPADILSQFCN
jgi:tetratricopeptide (TPR) repeat protein